VIKSNVAAVGLAGATVVTDRAERLLSRPPDPPDRYDLVFADPPYAVSAAAVARVLTLLSGGWLAGDALVVVERATRSGPLEWPPGYLPGKSRRYGEATFWYGWNGGGAVAGHPQQAARRPALEE
jgi:16S rRNA (guanine966-N2)-methyltransferase